MASIDIAEHAQDGTHLCLEIAQPLHLLSLRVLPLRELGVIAGIVDLISKHLGTGCCYLQNLQRVFKEST